MRALKPLLDRFGNERDLTIILFTLDETTYSRELAPLAGHYPVLKLGPPWWFHDSPEGMLRFREQATETAGFYNTVGFNDDTRAFLSIPARHDVARRIDCRFLATLVVEHKIGEDEAFELAPRARARLRQGRVQALAASCGAGARRPWRVALAVAAAMSRGRDAGCPGVGSPSARKRQSACVTASIHHASALPGPRFAPRDVHERSGGRGDSTRLDDEAAGGDRRRGQRMRAGSRSPVPRPARRAWSSRSGTVSVSCPASRPIDARRAAGASVSAATTARCCAICASDSGSARAASGCAGATAKTIVVSASTRMR